MTIFQTTHTQASRSPYHLVCNPLCHGLHGPNVKRILGVPRESGFTEGGGSTFILLPPPISHFCGAQLRSSAGISSRPAVTISPGLAMENHLLISGFHLSPGLETSVHFTLDYLPWCCHCAGNETSGHTFQPHST